MPQKVEGWTLEHDGKGHITVRHDKTEVSYVVDASNPLLDGSIVDFWKTFPGSENVKWQLERIADAYRRYLLSSGEWGRIRVEAEAKPVRGARQLVMPLYGYLRRVASL
jgi:hypothetical protein